MCSKLQGDIHMEESTATQPDVTQGATVTEGQPTEPVTAGDSENKTYSQKEFESYADKRVTQAIETTRKKTEEEANRLMEEKIAAALEEQKRLSEMDKDQLREYEQEKAKAERDELLAQIALRDSKDAAVSALIESNANLKLAEFIVDADSDQMNNKLQSLLAIIESEKEAARNEILATGHRPRTSDGKPVKDDVKGMPVLDGLKALRQNQINQ